MFIVIVSLLFVGTAVILSNRYQEKNSISERMTTVSQIIADRSTAALSFDDKKAAIEILSALDEESTVVMACTYNSKEALFASFIKNKSQYKCPIVTPRLIYEKGHWFLDEYFELYQPVVLDEEIIGSVYLKTSLNELNARQLHFIFLLISIIVIAGLVAYILAVKQQSVISKPILELADIAKHITNEADYSMSIPITSNDEIGELKNAFNNMLEQIRKREAARDVAENELIAKEKNLNITLNSIADAVITTDANGEITRMNPVAEHLTGWSYSEARGKKLKSVFKLIDNVSQKQIENPFKEVLLTNDVVYLGANTILIAKDGTQYRIADSASGAPIKGERDIIRGVILVFSDLTKQYQTEEALRRSQKMDAIGQLSGGIAHDFNNRLGVIIGYLDVLKNYLGDDEKATKWLNTALKASLRCADLTRQLLAFSRNEATINKQHVQVGELLKELEDMVARSVTPEVEIKYFLADDLWMIETDTGEFHDVILNLVINAHDAMPNGGKILIEASNCYLDADYAKYNPDVKIGDYVQILLSDTGTGMDDYTLERIFEPFYTTKPKGKGTGLGMSMVYGFIKRYNGHIKIYSELEIGTTIRMYLPRSENSNVQNESQTNINILPTGTENILIVDDEEDLLKLASQYLGELNYTVYSCENGIKALEILNKNDSINLLFSDVVMPGGINGYQLAQQATEIKPDLKILLTSGFTTETIIQKHLSHFATNILSKPYRKSELANRIRLVLDSKPLTATNDINNQKHRNI